MKVRIPAELKQQIYPAGPFKHPSNVMKSMIDVPKWLFYPVPEFGEFNSMEIAALLHIIHYTTPEFPEGYIAESEMMEHWCNATPEEVDAVLNSLEEKGLIWHEELDPSTCRNPKRNYCWFADVTKMHNILVKYNREVWF